MRARSNGDSPLLVAITGWGQTIDRERAHAAGFDLHMTKPVGLAALEAALALRAGAAAPHNRPTPHDNRDMRQPTVPSTRRLLAAVLCAACAMTSAVPSSTRSAPRPSPGADALDGAREHAQRARRSGERRAATHWLACARDAYAALAAGHDATASLALANECTDAWTTLALHGEHDWRAGRMRVENDEIEVEFRDLSPYLGETLHLTRAAEVSMRVVGGTRFVRPGLGVPLAAVSPRCGDRPLCDLLPYSGVFRPATLWIEPSASADARVVIGDPLRASPKTYGSTRVVLAEDTSASYAYGMTPSPIGRLAIWGLLGGDDVGKRAGVYLMEDYDPRKRPLIMVHGLGSSPLAWANLSNAVWGDPQLRRRFQVWHMVYSTDDPLFVARDRIASYLDTAWSTLDPEGDDPSRHGAVLVGHSLGGVLARLLCVDTGDALWSTAFTVPPADMPGDPSDVAAVERLLVFKPYPGVARAIFLAAPHQGSPLADRWYARFVKGLAGRPPPEMQSLRRIALTHPEVVHEDLLPRYTRGSITSISTLQASQPMRRASEKLMPVSGIPYHTIAGRLPRRSPEGDGVVPLASATIPGAASTRVVDSGHDLYADPDAIAEILRILRDDVAASEGTLSP
ncbi:MAG TPA: hypothetical protein VGD42_07850 [Lysobacter sp.]